MKVTKRYNQYRRDFSIDMKCEGYGATDTYARAYDDRRFWDKVVPSFTCRQCGKSSRDLGTEIDYMPTRYPEGFQV